MWYYQKLKVLSKNFLFANSSDFENHSFHQNADSSAAQSNKF